MSRVPVRLTCWAMETADDTSWLSSRAVRYRSSAASAAAPVATWAAATMTSITTHQADPQRHPLGEIARAAQN
jgi:hypothetical protein